MDRRQFVKHAGIGALGLGALAASPGAVAGYRKGDGHQHFSLVSLSGTSAAEVGSDNVMLLEGAASFKAKTGQVDREGGGNFNHIRFTPAFPAGQQLLASGTWEPTGFAGLLTGQPEGFQLNLPGLGLNFDNPLVGLTHISIPEGESSA